MSNMTSLRASLLGEEFSHIMSFRRQVYVQPNENLELPSPVVIEHDDTTYRVFLAYDVLTCFACKEIGHIAKNCTKTPNLDTVEDVFAEIHTSNPTTPGTRHEENEEKTTSPGPIQVQEEIVATEIKTQDHSSYTSNIHYEENNNKRPPPPSSTSSFNSTLSHISQNPSPNKHKRKKIAESIQSVSVLEKITPVKEVIEKSPEEYVLNYEQFCNFLETTLGSKNPLSIALTYTSNISGLLDMLYKLHPYIEDRAIKGRTTRIRNKIKRQLNPQDFSTASELDSDSSTSGN